ncbi:uncharacterized protein LOC106092233 [Stomoxys calcitrans]|uniref:Uncharacterized protein n=1 Tax=Stomoxys calcitrans TaxID=35570 RepID=A0A1I8QF04_STOCA|nr:uncharacterized protein LOC106092233 [Stomoxys calcitrans]
MGFASTRSIGNVFMGFIYMALIVAIFLILTQDLLNDLTKDSSYKDTETMGSGCIKKKNYLGIVVDFFDNILDSELLHHLARHTMQLFLLILLVMGLKMQRHLLMLPWIIVNIVGLIIVTLWGVFVYTMKLIVEDDIAFTASELQFIAFVFVCWFGIFPIYKAYKMIKDFNNLPRYRGKLIHTSTYI